jgi:hypothetical protein
VPATAHCDTLDGPVASAGRRALATGDIHEALVWVRPDVEPELRAAFRRALRVRRQGADSRELADRYFLETLVRLHRAGEGAPYTGLEPPGAPVLPAIAAADRAVEGGSVAALEAILLRSASEGLRARFARLQRLRRFRPHDVAAGRRYVAAYVEFIHYAERLHEDTAGEAHGHAPEPPQDHQDARDAY